ncbi:MAG: hypothetical protein Q8L56_02385 [Rhodocyclaceae bacterium]|nr:hypothetical protein [Rhodocyclaceae bacterium]
MNGLALIGGLAGGVGLFLLGMGRMTDGLPADNARRLPELLRVARHYETATELAVEASAAIGETAECDSGAEARAFAAIALQLLARSDPTGTVASTDIDATASAMEHAYQSLKAGLLAAGAQGRLPVHAMDARLRAASALRRALEQSIKATRLLASGTSEATPDPAQQEAS